MQLLLELPLSDRRHAVARDLRSRAPQYREVPAHDLADALGIPDPWCPGDGWSFIWYAHIVAVEEYLGYNDEPPSELIYLIEQLVNPKRFQRLVKLSESLDKVSAPSFSFLTKKEREALERAIATRELEQTMTNGIGGIARCSVRSSSGEELEFEAEIEDDGACINLRTPYDKRAKRFVDLTGCVTID